MEVGLRLAGKSVYAVNLLCWLCLEDICKVVKGRQMTEDETGGEVEAGGTEE